MLPSTCTMSTSVYFAYCLLCLYCQICLHLICFRSSSHYDHHLLVLCLQVATLHTGYSVYCQICLHLLCFRSSSLCHHLLVFAYCLLCLLPNMSTFTLVLVLCLLSTLSPLSISLLCQLFTCSAVHTDTTTI